MNGRAGGDGRKKGGVWWMESRGPSDRDVGMVIGLGRDSMGSGLIKWDMYRFRYGYLRPHHLFERRFYLSFQRDLSVNLVFFCFVSFASEDWHRCECAGLRGLVLGASPSLSLS